MRRAASSAWQPLPPPPAVAAALRAKVSVPEHVELLVRPRSVTQLEDAAQDLRSRIAGLAAGEVQLDGIAVSARQTTGGALVEYAGPERAAFEERVVAAASVPVDFIHGAPLIEDAVCYNPAECSDTPPRGGIAINSVGGLCTAGFVVKNYSGVPKMLTNGHCRSGNDEIFFPSPTNPSANGKKFGRYENESYNGADRDVAVFDMVAEYEAAADNGVFRTQSSPNYPIYSSGPGGVYEGANVCKTGRTTGYRCAPIYSTNYNGSGAFVSNQCGRFGDSGGPGFNLNNSALGLMTRAGNAGFYGNGTCGSVERSIFVYINYNASLMSTSVFLG